MQVNQRGSVPEPTPFSKGSPVGKLITRSQQVREANDVRYAEVLVPEWGGENEADLPEDEQSSIRLRSFSAQALVAFTSLKGVHEKQGLVRGLIMSACDQHGELIFTNEDVKWLMEKSVKVLRRLQDAILELNGLNKKKDQKEELEEAGKD